MYAKAQPLDANRRRAPATLRSGHAEPVGRSMSETESTPAPKASLLRRLVVFLLMCGLAFGGGIAATIAYDRMVEAPADDAPATPISAAARPAVVLPPAEPPPAVPLDPLAQAIAAVRPQLPELAVLEVTVRRQANGVIFLEGQADSRRTVALAADGVGRVAGVTAVDVRGITLVERTHVVEAGENPAKIARRYYGPAGHYRLIVEANPKLKAGFMGVGDTLVIPPLDR